jgi:predicted Zn-dependent protease
MQRFRTALTAILISGLWASCGIFQAKQAPDYSFKPSQVGEDGEEVQFSSAFLQANAQYLAGNYDAAYLEFQKLEKERPDLAAVPWRLGEIKLAQRQPGAAVVHIRRAIDLDPENTWYREFEAKALVLSGEHEAALAVRMDLLNRFPTRSAYYQDVVRHCVSRQQYDQALEVLSRREKQFGMRESVTDQKVRILSSQNKWAEAADEVAGLRAKYPDRQKYMLWEARMAQKGNFNERAMNLLTTFLQMDPENAEALGLRVQILSGRGDYPLYFSALKLLVANPNMVYGSKHFYLQAWADDLVNPLLRDSTVVLAGIVEQLHRDDPAALLYCGDAWMAANEYPRAARLYRKALDSGQAGFGVYEKLLTALQRASDFAEMEKTAQQMADDFPSQPSPWRYLAFARYRQFNYAGSAEACRMGQAFAIDRDDKIKLANQLAQAEYRAGRAAEAVAILEPFYIAYPSEYSLANSYAFMLAAAGGKMELAAQIADQLMKEQPGNPYFIDTWGWILFKSGKTLQAIPFFEKAILLAPGNADILEHTGDAWKLLGNETKAKVFWEDALKSGGDPKLLKKKING